METQPPPPGPTSRDVARAAETLRCHFVEGRLSIDDYDRWMTMLHRARTLPELQALIRSIPPALPPPPPGRVALLPRSPSGAVVTRHATAGKRTSSVAALAIVALLGLLGGLWILGVSTMGDPGFPEEPPPTLAPEASALDATDSASAADATRGAEVGAADEAVPLSTPVAFGSPVGAAPPPFLVEASSDGSTPGAGAAAAAERYLRYAEKRDAVGLRQHLCRPLREHFDDRALVARLDQEVAGRPVTHADAVPTDQRVEVTMSVGASSQSVRLRTIVEEGAWKVCGAAGADGIPGYLLVPPT